MSPPTERIVGKDDVYVVIGDTHEHVNALQETINLVGNKYLDKNIKYVLVGDYLDKGGRTKSMMDFMWFFVHAKDVTITCANHESYVYKRIKNILPEKAEVEAKAFTSVAFFKDPANKEYADKLVELWEEHTVPFLKLTRLGRKDIFVTHAPCPNGVLGKTDDISMRDQRNIHRKSLGKDPRLTYEFIFAEADEGHGFIHLFGHVSHSSSQLNYKNKWFLDTGAIYGHKLTAMAITSDGEEVISIITGMLRDEALPDNLTLPMTEKERKENGF